MQKLFEYKIFYHLLFIIVFGYFFHDLRLDITLTQPPHGVHQWRQSDGASMARIFSQENNSVVQPKIFNQFGDDGSAGGEFPLFYFVGGKVYSILGYHPFILRFIFFLPLLAGLFFILNTLLDFYRAKLLAVLSVFLVICSPTFMNYSVSTLPDAAAFGLALIGSSFLITHRSSNTTLSLVLSSLAFIIAGLTKISMLLPMFAFLATFIFCSFWRKERNTVFVKWLVYGTFTMVPIVAWYQYISWYNLLHETTYFATSIRPIWHLNTETILQIWNQVLEFWVPTIFTRWYLLVILLALLVTAFSIKSFKKEPLIFTLLLVVGSITYSLLFFINLEQHDYYFLPFFFPMLALIVLATKSIDIHLKNNWIRVASILLLGTISWQTAHAAVIKTRKTYQGWFNDLDLSESLYDIESFLTENNIPQSSKFVVPQDESSNISLFFLNRAGYTKLSGVYDVEDLDPLIDKGVEYALVLDTSFYSVTFLQYHITDTIGYHHELGIYKVGHSKWWNPEERSLAK